MEYLGLTPTGRIFKDVCADLIELEDSENRIHHALHYREEYRGHRSINIAVDLAASFLAYPMVVGLAELVQYDVNEGLFIYSAERNYTLAEVIRKYRGLSKTLGIKAALEFCRLAGRIVGEASENGANEGVFAHGDLSPARVFLTPEGKIEMLGYGLPQVEIEVYREDEQHILDVASLHYCPPERLEGNGEDVDGDLYAIVLIAIQMITGKPLYDGNIDRVKEMVRLSEGPQLLAKLGKSIPKTTSEVFQRALVYDPDRRFGSVQEFLDDIEQAIKKDGQSGDSLSDIMSRIGSPGSSESKGRGRRSVQEAGPTQSYSKSAGRTRSKQEAQEEETTAAPETRWGKVARGDEEEEKPRRRTRRSEESEAKVEAPAEEEKPRRRTRRSEESEAKVEAPAEEEKPRRRTRRSEESEAKVEAPAEEEKPRRRTRRSEESEAKAPAEEEKPRRRTRRSEESEAPAEEDSPRRTRRSRGSGDAEENDPPRRRRTRGATSEEEDEAPRRRRSRSSEEEEPAPSRRRRSVASDEEEASPRRRRRSSDDEEEASPRRRRSRSSDD